MCLHNYTLKLHVIHHSKKLIFKRMDNDSVMKKWSGKYTPVEYSPNKFVSSCMGISNKSTKSTVNSIVLYA